MLGSLMYFCLWGLLNLFRISGWWRWRIVDREHLPPPGVPTVVVANHIHWTDVHVVGASLPLARRPWWIAKSELFEIGFIAWWLRQMRTIPIRRGKRDLAALKTAEETLETGELVVVFPEGHRSETRSLIAGRGGAVRLAARSGSVIVPMAVWGTEQGFLAAMRRRPIEVRFGPPYTPQVESDPIPPEQMTALTDEMMLKIAALLPEKYQGVYRDKMLEQQDVAPTD
ncbi:MAG TPA: lysophospholipid acyltransferase family protein [Roseiflexaceae bacterium]|nr:lysophospholipid acyltransferase family protein [Roseiflexaceae bacterium]